MNSYEVNTHSARTTLDELSETLRLVGDPTRLKVLATLYKQGSHCVSDCMCHLPGVSQSLLSHHMADLKKAGLVKSAKQGKKVFYSLTSSGQELMIALSKLTKGDDAMDGCQCQGCTCQNCNC